MMRSIPPSDFALFSRPHHRPSSRGPSGRSSPVLPSDALPACAHAEPVPGTILHMLAGPRAAWAPAPAGGAAARASCRCPDRDPLVFASERMLDLVAVQRVAEITVHVDAAALYSEEPPGVRGMGRIALDLTQAVLAPPAAGHAAGSVRRFAEIEGAPCDPARAALAGPCPSPGGALRLPVRRAPDEAEFVDASLWFRVRVLREDGRGARRVLHYRAASMVLPLGGALPGCPWLVDAPDGVGLVLRCVLAPDRSCVEVSAHHFDFTTDQSADVLLALHRRLRERVVDAASAECSECSLACRVASELLLGADDGCDEDHVDTACCRSEPMRIPPVRTLADRERLPGAASAQPSPETAPAEQGPIKTPCPIEFMSPIDRAFTLLDAWNSPNQEPISRLDEIE
jgi:hypothetical protein